MDRLISKIEHLTSMQIKEQEMHIQSSLFHLNFSIKLHQNIQWSCMFICKSKRELIQHGPTTKFFKVDD